MNIDIKNCNILITGGAGFLGSFIMDKLIEKGVKKQDIRIPISKDSDMRKEGLKPIGKGDAVLNKYYPHRWWKVD